MILTRTAALMLAGLAVPAIAQTAATAPTPAKPDRKVCRMVDTTGTIMMGTRVCHTKAEWQVIDSRNSDNVTSSRDIRGGGGSPRGQ